MSETPFFKTGMGRTFFERDVPALVRELARLNTLLDALVAQRDESPVVRESSRETEQS